MSEDRCGTRKNVRGQSFRQSCDGEVAHVLPSSGTGEVEIRKFIAKMDMSLDGFVAGPNGESDWIFETCDEGCTLWEVETIWQAVDFQGLSPLGGGVFQRLSPPVAEDFHHLSPPGLLTA